MQYTIDANEQLEKNTGEQYQPKSDHIMQFFKYDHLPPQMQETSRPFCELAQQIVDTIPSNPERSAGLRKLMEAKDCIVRAMIAK